MQVLVRSLLVGLVVVVAAAGCGGTPPAPADPEADVRANLAQLPPDDQRPAAEQEYCPLMDGVRLGEMGPPYKVTINGVTAFVCCEGCVRAAGRDPDQALAKIWKLQQERAAGTASAR